MKALLQKLIQLRNPAFKFDENLDSLALLQFFWIQGIAIIRGLFVFIYFKKAKGLMLGRAVTFFNPSKIHWGKFLRLGNHVAISALGKNGIWFVGSYCWKGIPLLEGCVASAEHVVTKGIALAENINIQLPY